MLSICLLVRSDKIISSSHAAKSPNVKSLYSMSFPSQPPQKFLLQCGVRVKLFVYNDLRTFVLNPRVFIFKRVLSVFAVLTPAIPACQGELSLQFRIRRLTEYPLHCVQSITLGPHEAGVWAKHPSLTIPAPSSGEPSRHLGSSYQRGVSILSPLIADLSGLWGSSMQVMHGRPQGLFSR